MNVTVHDNVDTVLDEEVLEGGLSSEVLVGRVGGGVPSQRDQKNSRYKSKA